MKQRTEGEQKPKHGPWYWILTAVLPVVALALSAAIVFGAILLCTVRFRVTIELGTDSPEASAFVRPGAEAVYDVAPEACYRQPGDYRLRIRTGHISVPVTLCVRDTVAPAAEGTEITISTKEAPTPDKLIKNLRDESVVKITFENAPDYGRVGDYDAVMALEDAGGNTARVPVRVHIRATVDAITVEAGDRAPKPEDFLVDRYETVEMTPITEAMLREPGEYTIRFLADGAEANSKLIVRDTVPPTAKGVTRVLAPGEPIRAGELVTDIQDESAVTAEFVSPPDPESRVPQTLEIVLTDRGGNETRVYSTLLITSVTPQEVEAHAGPLEIKELQLEGTYSKAEMSWAFVPNEPGPHVITVLIDGKENYALIEVKDTTPPEIEILKNEGYQDHPMDVTELAIAYDVTGASVAYATEPDWMRETQDVTVYALDADGNRSELTFTLTLLADTDPPVLFGVQDRYCYVDEAVAYLDEVSAQDACDGPVEVTVDASAVNSKALGDYPVTYTATDRAGNSVSKTVTFRFVEARVSDKRAQEVADKYIAKILTDDMTLAEQIEAIYDYVYENVRYSARSNKRDWRSEAVRGLTTGRGDCFTSYAAARLLLERTDAQIVSVTRKSNTSHHYWMLVNIGTGWYHYDACRAWTGKYRCFMWTDAETRRHSKSYWRYDKSLYPPVATEPFDGGN